MPRTTTLNSVPDQHTEHLPRRRQVPPEYERETRCYWPCPCGGTVPDAPDHCVWRKRRGKANTYCTDASICASQCPDKGVCESYQEFRRQIKDRKRKDELEFIHRHQKEDVQNEMPTMRNKGNQGEEKVLRRVHQATETRTDEAIQAETAAKEPPEKTVRRRIINGNEAETPVRRIRRG
jgi:ribosomal protein S20